jgi:hypothetical protein
MLTLTFGEAAASFWSVGVAGAGGAGRAAVDRVVCFGGGRKRPPKWFGSCTNSWGWAGRAQ